MHVLKVRRLGLPGRKIPGRSLGPEIMDTIQTAFDQAYWASQPPEVRALPGIANQDDRTSAASSLAAQGFTIDVPIMVWSWDAYLVMKMRADAGYTWVPSALQAAITIAPGLGAPGAIPYDPSNPPAGAIKVSLHLPDYPPYPAPAAPPTAVPSSDPVGAQSIGNIYLTTLGDNYANGAQITDSRGTFQKVVTITPFGRSSYWQKIS